jgi:ligand-binding sensor protein
MEEGYAMELVDIMPVDKWAEIEKEINKRAGFNACVYNTQGVRITEYRKWANRLCPAIRETDKGLQSICSVAHQNIAARAVRSRSTIIDECDAGLMKFAVPIFVEDEFVGVAGGCGKLRGEGQVDTYLVHRTAGLDEKVVQDLAGEIETIDEDRLKAVVNYVEEKVKEVIEEFRAGNTDGEG